MSETPAVDFASVFVAATTHDVTLLLLHGTGGTEHDLVPLGNAVAPGAAYLSPRGQVLEHGMSRFFRRFAEGVFDIDDLRRRADQLAQWVRASIAAQAAPTRILAVGYSNGANIASALMLQHPDLLAGAILYRAMVPYVPEPLPALGSIPVLVCAGTADPVVPTTEAERLAALLRACGAVVTLEWITGGHGLTPADVTRAREFAARLLG